MTIRTLTLSATLALAALGAQAAPATPIDMPLAATMLDRVVVTPTARYTSEQWQMRQAQRQAVVLDQVVVTPRANYTVAEWQARQAAKPAVVAVMLEPVIVTPSAHYTLAQWQQRQAGLVTVSQKPESRGMKRWLKMVWRHFQFAGTQVEA